MFEDFVFGEAGVSSREREEKKGRVSASVSFFVKESRREDVKDERIKKERGEEKERGRERKRDVESARHSRLHRQPSLEPLPFQPRRASPRQGHSSRKS